MEINFYKHNSVKKPQIRITKDGIATINYAAFELFGGTDFRYALIGISICGLYGAIKINNDDGYKLSAKGKHGRVKSFTARLAIKKYRMFGVYDCWKDEDLLLFNLRGNAKED